MTLIGRFSIVREIGVKLKRKSFFLECEEGVYVKSTMAEGCGWWRSDEIGEGCVFNGKA